MEGEERSMQARGGGREGGREAGVTQGKVVALSRKRDGVGEKGGADAEIYEGGRKVGRERKRGRKSGS